jgi:hypothetical protein
MIARFIRRLHLAQPSAGDHGSEAGGRRFNRRDYKLAIKGNFRFAAAVSRVYRSGFVRRNPGVDPGMTTAGAAAGSSDDGYDAVFTAGDPGR